MSHADAVNQDSNIQIPRRGQCLNQAVDTTARKIDMQLLPFNGEAFRAGTVEWLFLDMLNESATASLYFYATDSADAADLDNTEVLAAGTPPTGMPNSHCFVLLPLQRYSYRIHRQVDRYLVVKGSAALNVRLTVSSDSTTRLY